MVLWLPPKSCSARLDEKDRTNFPTGNNIISLIFYEVSRTSFASYLPGCLLKYNNRPDVLAFYMHIGAFVIIIESFACMRVVAKPFSEILSISLDCRSSWRVIPVTLMVRTIRSKNTDASYSTVRWRYWALLAFYTNISYQTVRKNRLCKQGHWMSGWASTIPLYMCSIMAISCLNSLLVFSFCHYSLISHSVNHSFVLSLHKDK